MGSPFRNLATVRRVLQSDRRLEFAVVFGSVARGTPRPESDLDVALGARVSLDPMEGRLLRLSDALSRLCGRAVQLVPLPNAPLDLRVAVARDGRLLWARERRAFQRFVAHTWIEHADMEPMAAMVRRAFFDRVIQEGRG